MVSSYHQRKQRKTEGGKRKLLEVMDKFMPLLVMVVSWMYTYLQTGQVV